MTSISLGGRSRGGSGRGGGGVLDVAMDEEFNG
jgi:hypothetical protein